jgi:hypothetical protein
VVDDVLADYVTPAADGPRQQFRTMLAEPRQWDQVMQDTEDYAEALTDAGLTPVQITESRPVTLPLDIEAFMAYALAWAPRHLELEALSPAARTACLTTIQHQLSVLPIHNQLLRWSPSVLRCHAVF